MATVLPDLQAQIAQLQQIIVKQQEAMDALKAAKTTKIGYKVSEKGGVSLSGFGRFPITHYASQWIRILDNEAELRLFIEANRSKLAWKE